MSFGIFLYREQGGGKAQRQAFQAALTRYPYDFRNLVGLAGLRAGNRIRGSSRQRALRCAQQASRR